MNRIRPFQKGRFARFCALLIALTVVLSLCSCLDVFNPPAQSPGTVPSVSETAETPHSDTNPSVPHESDRPSEAVVTFDGGTFHLSDVPAFDGATAYVAVNNNTPFFSGKEIAAAVASYESYADLDTLGRCGTAVSSVGRDLMPTEERGSIGVVKPSGWQTVKYDIVSGNYLYNRCHLIGYQLTGENANVKNLITGTRFLNIDGMLPFENLATDYVKETGNHVLYRVTPVFVGDELVARGVLMEGMSVEDGGEDVLFCVFCYNNQPGIHIDYLTGDSCLLSDVPETATSPVTDTPTGVDTTDSDRDTAPADSESVPAAEIAHYVLNTSSMKFHLPTCKSLPADKNRADYTGSRDDLLQEGYSPCGVCKP